MGLLWGVMPLPRTKSSYHAEVMRMMRTSINHEITDREPHNGYIVLQGGLPDTEEYIKKYWK